MEPTKTPVAAGAEAEEQVDVNVTTEPEQLEVNEVEQSALDKGWQNEEDWIASGKDPSEWRSAREFLDRGELLDRIKDQSRELKSLTAIVGQLSEQNKAVYKAGYVKAINDLKMARAHAIKEGDGDAVNKIDDAIDQTKAAIYRIDATPTQPQQQVGETEAFKDFKSRNQWFERDDKMRKWAYGTGMQYANEHPQASEADVYRYVEQEVRKEFPESQSRRGSAPPGPDGESRRGNGRNSGDGSSRSFERILAGMPEDQARVARDMVRRGIVSKEKYVQDYESVIVGR